MKARKFRFPGARLRVPLVGGHCDNGVVLPWAACCDILALFLRTRI